MFVGWINIKEFEHYQQTSSKKIVVDEALFAKHLEYFPHLCFKCKDENAITGLGCVGLYDDTARIRVFEGENIASKKALLEIIQNNLYAIKTQYALIKTEDVELFSEFGFIFLKRFFLMEYRGTQVAFHFSQAHAKEVNQENFSAIAHKIHQKNIADESEFFIKTELDFQSSLKFATNFGFLHSRALGNKILISPWEIMSEAYMDAEKLLRAVLYHRGLKKIVAYVPDEAEILSLCNSYKFEKQSEYCVVYKGIKPEWQMENIYSL